MILFYFEAQVVPGLANRSAFEVGSLSFDLYLHRDILTCKLIYGSIASVFIYIRIRSSY